jgi:hypothetical protein
MKKGGLIPEEEKTLLAYNLLPGVYSLLHRGFSTGHFRGVVGYPQRLLTPSALDLIFDNVKACHS